MTLAAPKSSDSTPAAAASSPGQCNDTRVAYLGPVGTYSHEVTQQRFPGSEYTLTPYPTIHDAVHALLPEQQDQEQEGGSSTVASWAVVPLENSSFGPVLETHQVLVEPAVVRYTRTLHERIRFNVRHCLIAYAPPVTHPHLLPPSSPPTVRTIYSHPQALGQCREYIAQHYPEVDTVATASTAEAASLVAADPSRQSLAIGSPACIRYFPLLVVLQFDIQDAGQDNFTTFIVIQRKN